MGWEDLRDSTAREDRIKAQKEWAERRDQHFNNPNPGLWGSIVRSLGNAASNWNLERMEKRDLDWKHAEKDADGGYILDSPIDEARFNVYQRILNAKKANMLPDPSDLSQWNQIKRGEIPE